MSADRYRLLLDWAYRIGVLVMIVGVWAVKIDRHGKAKILSQAEIQLLFNEGLESNRDRALFGICLYCCCRINEACTLSVTDVYDRAGRVRAELIIRKGNTKGKLATRVIPVIEDLRVLLKAYQLPVERSYLFPGRWGRKHITSDSAARILREAFARGSISGNVLTGYWSEDSSGRRCDTARNGRYYWGRIRFVFNGSSFEGFWGYCNDVPAKTWTGNRISP